MTDTTRCAHRVTVPVEVPDHTADPGCTSVVARVCTDCLDQLPAAWGCTDCEWNYLEERAMCEHRPTTYVLLTRPCFAHRGTA